MKTISKNEIHPVAREYPIMGRLDSINIIIIPVGMTRKKTARSTDRGVKTAISSPQLLNNLKNLPIPVSNYKVCPIVS
jgi:hypothetical protein